MGCTQSKDKVTVTNLQQQVDELRHQLKSQHETDGRDYNMPPVVTAVAVTVLEDDNHDEKWSTAVHHTNTDMKKPSAPPLSVDSLTPLDFECLYGGDIQIGPGSYYTDDEECTIIREDVSLEQDAIPLVNELDSSDNPVVMWQIINERSSQPILMMHRLKFMSQNLDADTNASPKEFASSTKSFVEGRNGWTSSHPVHVRSNTWFQQFRNQYGENLKKHDPTAATTTTISTIPPS